MRHRTVKQLILGELCTGFSYLPSCSLDEMKPLSSIELCAGAGGQALGLERAGFKHVALVEIDPHACATLRHNRPHWNVIEADITTFDGRPYAGV
ncbi:MAG TPA: DNA cytosine methyltransferase, partial [Acidobacteriaceae bacterium]|nr:DNA cytosine methyltransferase [Acidobacteriaceae bacterium]